MDNLEILEFNGEGYMPQIEFNSWRVAIVNYCDRIDEKNLCKVENTLKQYSP